MVKIFVVLVVVAAVVLSAGRARAQLDRLLQDRPSLPSATSANDRGDATIAAGLTEALRVGIDNAVTLTGRTNGYFANQAIKIRVPERLRSLESGLRTAGRGALVDEFVLSMNRAAERAAPVARDIFAEALGAMSFDDARRILGGGNTAATEYFKAKTTDRLGAAFRPVVERAMSEVGVNRRYREMVGRAQALPFVSLEALDLDQYVVGRGLDGLFHVLGEEERKIRETPAARVTELLRDVFGKR